MITDSHAESVSDLAARLAGQLGFPGDDVIRLRVAGVYHDAAKLIDRKFYEGLLGVSLTREDPRWDRIRLHPELSAGCYETMCRLANIPVDALVCEAVLGHHLDYHGGSHTRGYPIIRLSDKGFRFCALLRICDSYAAALSRDRLHQNRRIKDAYEVLQEIADDGGERYRPDYAEVFVDMMRAEALAA